jgi:hypothetical protein
MLVQISWECTPSYLSTGISNLLQPAQTEVVLGQRSTYLASWDRPHILHPLSYSIALSAGSLFPTFYYSDSVAFFLLHIILGCFFFDIMHYWFVQIGRDKP